MQCAKPALKASFRSRAEKSRAETGEFWPMCKVAAVMLLFSLLLASSGCGGRVNLQALSGSERTPYGNSAADQVESQTKVKLRSLEF